MRQPSLLLIAIFLLFPALLPAQTFSGRVLDEKGNPAVNISVVVKGTTSGTTTDAKGVFTLTISQPLPVVLIFSGVGFEAYEVPLNEKVIANKKFEVVLLATRTELSEVVVMGYGTKKKMNMASSVTPGSSTSIVYSSLGLSGKVAGVSLRKGKSKKEKKSLPEYQTSEFFSTTTSVDYASPSDKKITGDLVAMRTGKSGKSKILTAGEVNDFTKWKMWEDYSDNEFKSYSEYWHIKPSQRYSVQVLNKEKIAQVNEAVYLIDRSTKDTLWKTFTDNTGKAELWGSFFADSVIEKNVFITDSRGNRLDHPSQFENGLNLLVKDGACKVSDEVDIAFVVDATGSMGDEIEFLKLELEDVLRSTMEKYKSLSLRAGSVFYRDKTDEYLARKVSFSDDLLSTINFVKLQQAAGGGDTPEAVDDALSVALDSLQWNPNARTRLLFLVLDAPPHGDAIKRMQQLISKAAQKGVRIIPIACSGTDKSTEFLLRSMALATNGTYAFLTDHSGVGGSHIEPTTDKYDVELLNGLLQRLIGQFLYATACDTQTLPAIDTRQVGNVLQVKLFPNPTNGQFTIESTHALKDIYIADFTGKILMRLSDQGKTGQWRVDIGKYPSGVYFVKYLTEEGKWGAEKVVLMR